jgi:hypothetical protein
MFSRVPETGQRIQARPAAGKRTRRSLTYSPCLGEAFAGEGWRVITRTKIALDAALGYYSPHLSPQSLAGGGNRGRACLDLDRAIYLVPKMQFLLDARETLRR